MVWRTCAWPQCRTRFQARPTQRFCSQSCGAFASAMRKSGQQWRQQMRRAGHASGRIRRAIALRRAMKALGARPTIRELTAFQIGWRCAITTRYQRRRVQRRTFAA